MRHSYLQVKFWQDFWNRTPFSRPDTGMATRVPLGFITTQLRKPRCREMKSPVPTALGQPADPTMETWNTFCLSNLMTELAIKNNNSNNDNKFGSSTTWIPSATHNNKQTNPLK